MSSLGLRGFLSLGSLFSLLLYLLCFLLHFLLLFWLFGFFGLLILSLLLFWLLLLLVRQEVSAEERLKHFWYSQTVFCLIILQDAAKGALSGTKSSVKHMNVPLFSFLNRVIYTSFFFDPHLMPRFLDWKSVQFEHETSSLYASYPGNQASRSYFLAAASLSAPETMEMTR